MDFIPCRNINALDAAYPKNLTDAGIKSSLYIMGDFKFPKESVYVGVIGCRKPSVYGTVVTQKIVSELVYHGCVVVSGFMYGIDLEAHNACVERGGTTVCVLGYGFNQLYDSIPQYIIDRFSSSGAFITEYEQNISPKKWTFAKRNKIIAGLCSLLIVIEAEQKSGSFITCHWARKFNRDVYAVPGSILSDKSEGTNKLICNNQAKMLTSVTELASIIGKTSSKSSSKLQSDDEVCQLISNVLLENPLGYDQLVSIIQSMTQLDILEIAKKLSAMELNSTVKCKGNMYYVS